MKVLMDIAHPAHVHLLRNTYSELKAKGHQVFVTVKEIPSAIQLLEHYEIPYINLGKKPDSLIGKALMQLKYNFQLWRLVVRHKIDIGFSSSITLTHVSRISKMHAIILDDDDDDAEPLFVKHAHPYADVVLTPSCVQRATPKALKYEGYHELAYLHPNWFIPDNQVLNEIGLKETDCFFILRFNAFKAHHDVGVQGLSLENKRELIALLETYGKVFITTEREIDDEFKKYQLRVAPHKIHSLMYYATMLIGDSQTMTSEAAILGTPALKCNTFAGKLSVPNEIEHKYQLCFSFLPEESANFFAKVRELLSDNNTNELFRLRKDRLLQDKVDVTAFFIHLIETYPL